MQRDTALFLCDLGVSDQLVEQLSALQPPPGNAYWVGRAHYIELNVRYLSIPILFDLFLKAQLTTLPVLLDTLSVLESELDVSEHEESGRIDFLSALHAIMDLPRIAHEYSDRRILRGRVLRYITTTPIYRSLRRGNFILPYFALLSSRDSAVLRMCELATSVITCGCILDDLNDYHSDNDTGEPNIIVELAASFDEGSIREATNLYRNAATAISRYNARLEVFLLSAFCNLGLRWRLSL